MPIRTPDYPAPCVSFWRGPRSRSLGRYIPLEDPVASELESIFEAVPLGAASFFDFPLISTQKPVVL